jgi:hypothetical protein
MGELSMSRQDPREGPTRLFPDKRGLELYRALMGARGARPSHEAGAVPRPRVPPGCLGDPLPTARYYHRACVVADHWERACAAGDCQYWDPQAMKPDRTKTCPGHRGVRRIRGTKCVVTWPGHCARRTKWGEVHEQTGKHALPVRQVPRLPSDEPAPWDRKRLREPGEDG